MAFYLPFQWIFFFPIQTLVGGPQPLELLAGFGMQLLWIVLEALLVQVVWHFSIRRFTSVGN